ncbi:MAG TPA: aminotransferase class I/II-fold pyridoxal phosphate-dependent enzyme [Kofleriaceae bacterium]|nr:aminotransferase class I/II-fold pyridoxal phosphate-dependent enzyme [Kofleriaceae bacterium]
MDHPFDAITLAELRTRRSAKWSHYPADVLPAWVAEMDYPLAEPIARALHAAIDRHDAGYAYPGDLGAVFATWAQATYGWTVEPRDVRLVPDVVTALAELVRAGTAPGDAIVIDPPVYPPFASTVRNAGRVLVEVPLATDGGRPCLDLDGLERAYAAGARMHILCSPQNPTGIVHHRASLAALADLAERYGVIVLADEIHAPLALPGATHVPFLSVSEAAARRGLCLTSASKAWNLAGLKAAVIVAATPAARAVSSKLGAELAFHAGHLGVIAARAAYREGGPWLAQTHAILDRNRALLGELLAAALPEIRYRPPEAGYLAWLDCRELGLPRDPAAVFLEKGRVALSPGPGFGPGGQGHARLNVGTTRALLEEAVARMAAAVTAARAGR